jgi:thiosulfate/3-mercaptopyruvate sulfurtransferase
MIIDRFNDPNLISKFPGIFRCCLGAILLLIVVISGFCSVFNLASAGMEMATSLVDSPDTPASNSNRAGIFMPLSNTSGKYIILDISPEAEEFIKNAININYEEFLAEGGKLKPMPEIARLLGQTGISRQDSVVITGECLPCGGGPAPATYAYWLLKYLGHEKVMVLDGDIQDWKAAGLPTGNEFSIRPTTNYTPQIKAELLATYDFVSNAETQIVDARNLQEFTLGSIPGAVNIPTEKVLDNESIRSNAELEKTFSGLRKDKPVVVFTNTGIQASLIWFALEMVGYDARLYSWQDWQENQPKFELKLAEAKAEPNPVKTGDTVRITAVFEVKITSRAKDAPSANETRLTIKQGCVTCGFGSPQGFANLDSKSGMIQIGASGKPIQTSEGMLKCSAVVKDAQGMEVDKISMLRTSGKKYVGIWNAKVAAGAYKISIIASESGSTKNFSDVLEINVTH